MKTNWVFKICAIILSVTLLPAAPLYAETPLSLDAPRPETNSKPYTGPYDELSQLPPVVGQKENPVPEIFEAEKPLSPAELFAPESEVIYGEKYDTILYRNEYGLIIRIQRDYKDEAGNITHREIFTEISTQKKNKKRGPTEDHQELLRMGNLFIWGRLDEVRYEGIRRDNIVSVTYHYDDRKYVARVYHTSNGAIGKVELHYRDGDIEVYQDFRKHLEGSPLPENYKDLYIHFKSEVATVWIMGRLKEVRHPNGVTVKFTYGEESGVAFKTRIAWNKDGSVKDIRRNYSDGRVVVYTDFIVQAEVFWFWDYSFMKGYETVYSSNDDGLWLMIMARKSEIRYPDGGLTRFVYGDWDKTEITWDSNGKVLSAVSHSFPMMDSPYVTRTFGDFLVLSKKDKLPPHYVVLYEDVRNGKPYIVAGRLTEMTRIGGLIWPIDNATYFQYYYDEKNNVTTVAWDSEGNAVYVEVRDLTGRTEVYRDIIVQREVFKPLPPDYFVLYQSTHTRRTMPILIAGRLSEIRYPEGDLTRFVYGEKDGVKFVTGIHWDNLGVIDAARRVYKNGIIDIYGNFIVQYEVFQQLPKGYDVLYSTGHSRWTFPVLVAGRVIEHIVPRKGKELSGNYYNVWGLKDLRKKKKK